MKFTNLVRIILITFITMQQLSGCADIDRIRPDTGEGRKVTVYRHGYDEIWDTALEVVGARLTIVESDKTAGIIKAEAEEETFGEVVGVFITPPAAGEKKYIIEVLALLKHRPRVAGQDPASVYIKELKARLEH